MLSDVWYAHMHLSLAMHAIPVCHQGLTCAYTTFASVSSTQNSAPRMFLLPVSAQAKCHDSGIMRFWLLHTAPRDILVCQ